MAIAYDNTLPFILVASADEYEEEADETVVEGVKRLRAWDYSDCHWESLVDTVEAVNRQQIGATFVLVDVPSSETVFLGVCTKEVWNGLRFIGQTAPGGGGG